MIGLFRCASPINLPSSVKKEKKMNNLTCWEHFFCTLIGVSSHHSPECVHACVCVVVRLQCVHSLGGNLLDFFLIIFSSNFSLSLHLSLFRSCVCMFFFLIWWLSIVVCVCVFLSLKFLLIFSHHLKTVFISATLVGWWAHRHTKTQAAKWQMVLRDKKRIYTTNRHSILCRLRNNNNNHNNKKKNDRSNNQ